MADIERASPARCFEFSIPSRNCSAFEAASVSDNAYSLATKDFVAREEISVTSSFTEVHDAIRRLSSNTYRIACFVFMMIRVFVNFAIIQKIIDNRKFTPAFFNQFFGARGVGILDNQKIDAMSFLL